MVLTFGNHRPCGAVCSLAAYLAASETALLRVSRIRVRYLVEKKVHKADKLEKLSPDPDRFYPTVLLLMVRGTDPSGALATVVDDEDYEQRGPRGSQWAR